MGSSLSVVLLGTGNPLPDANRAGAATLVRAGAKNFLVDAGRGVCMRLVAAGVLPVMLEAVFLTHLHSDHVCDLNDVITTHWIMSGQPGTLEAMAGPVKGRVRWWMGRWPCWPRTCPTGWPITADLTWEPDVSVRELGPGVVLDTGAVRVVAAATDHRPVEPTLAYRFEHDGRSVVLAGDTVPCAGLDELLVGADVYVQTVLREDLVRLVPMPRFVDTIDYHSTVEQAATTAARAGVDTLVLTHQVPTPPHGAADEWVALARAHFDGNIVFGEDLVEV